MCILNENQTDKISLIFKKWILSLRRFWSFLNLMRRDLRRELADEKGKYKCNFRLCRVVFVKCIYFFTYLSYVKPTALIPTVELNNSLNGNPAQSTFLSYVKPTTTIPTVELSSNNKHRFNSLNDNPVQTGNHPIVNSVNVDSKTCKTNSCKIYSNRLIRKSQSHT